MRGQSALDGFDPNANGAIRVIVVQPDGKALIGGEFTTLAPNSGATVVRNHIARLNPDGTLDSAFDPNANGSVYALALQSDGKIVVGGNFSGANSIGGQTRNYIARLDATTGAADSFDPNASLPVFAITVQSDGKIVVGGLFNGATSIGGQTRNYIARLDPTTGAADSFDPNANSYVSALLVQPNDKIVVGGDFSGANSIGGQTRNRIARLDPASGLADSFDPNANSTVLSIVQEADGKIIAGGDFSGPNSIGGLTRNFVARLDPLNGAADSFDPNANSLIFSVAVQPDGRILVGGSFTTIGGQTRNHIARLDPTSALADSFNSNASNAVFAIAVQPDNKILAGGDFTNAGAAVRNHIVRLETDGRLDQALNLQTVGTDTVVADTAIQADGKILIIGAFHSFLGTLREDIARLKSDGTLDTEFDPHPDGDVYAVALQPNGDILTVGSFDHIGGQTRHDIARLNAITGLADSFNPHPGDLLTAVYTVRVQANGKILIGGDFGNVGGQVRNNMASLDAATGLADSFNPDPSRPVKAIALQEDTKKILVAGNFEFIGGQSRFLFARLDATSGFADSFNPNPDSSVEKIVVQLDGKILVGGLFNNIGGQARRHIARLDPATGLADSFDPNPNGFDVYPSAVQSDGKVLVVGDFTIIGGQPRSGIARFDPTTGMPDSFNPNPNNFRAYSITLAADGKLLTSGPFTSTGGQIGRFYARLNNDTAALQDLTVTQSTITWMRGGSSPLLTYATFGYSTDNVNYIPLGNGGAAGSNWSLRGLNFPVGQNIYVRARGSYPSRGYSQSITESVRNTFFFGPTRVVSRKVHGSAGVFDIDLPLIGTPGIECRSGGADGDYQIVFTFASAATVDNAVVDGGTGSVSGVSGRGTSTITVNLTGVTNAQTINVGLLGASNGANTSDFSVPMAVLVGDTSGNGMVNASDLTKIKGQAGVPLADHNFREDVNASGSINATDIGIVKAQSGTALPESGLVSGSASF